VGFTSGDFEYCQGDPWRSGPRRPDPRRRRRQGVRHARSGRTSPRTRCCAPAKR